MTDRTTTLPAAYRAAQAAEQARVREQILAPRGLDRQTVLVVGGAGYIGSVLTPGLLDAGYGVTCLDRLLYENDVTVLPYMGRPGYRFVHGELARPGDVEAALDGVTDAVILGALVGDPITRKYPDESAAINHDGTLRLLEVLNGRGLNRLVFVSTCSNYGMIEGDGVATEDFPLKPLSLYAEAKVAVEQALLESKGRTDFHATIIRFATAFGLSPRMRFDLTISEFAREMYLGRELLVYDPDTWRPYCHVRDFSEVIVRVLAAPVDDVAFEVFNAGGDVNNHTKRSLVGLIQAFLPAAKVRYQERGSDPRNYRVNFAKIRDRLHFGPRLTVRDGIAELIAAMNAHLFDHVESRPAFYGNHVIAYP